MRKLIITLFAAATALFSLSGCRSVPISERTQLLFTTAGYENELGAEASSEYKQKFPRSSNSTYNTALARVGEAVSKAADQKDFEWEFIVLEDETANAFCLPGGKVAVYSGIFPYMANEAELACVVAHEVAHAVARHSGERLSWAQLQSLGAWAVSSTLQSETIDAIYGIGTQFGVMLPFSRANESEADRIGLILMARAGYDPRAALSFWKKFGGEETQSRLATWTSTHPGGADRIRDLEEELPTAEEEYRKAKVQRGYGATFSR